MSDRLKDLQRQRALAQEQLAWIDREIAQETGQAVTPVLPSTPPVRTITRPVSKAAAAQAAEEILAQYQHEGGDPAATQRAVKRGCLLYFGLAMLLLAAALTGLYFYSRNHH